jgi:hypothetical protein
MKNAKLPIFLLMLTLIASCLFLKANTPKAKKLRHVVAFKFKPEVTTEQMEKATTDFHNLKAQIPQIIEFEGGPDISMQEKMGKYTHCFVVTVNNEKDLDIYGSHPVHKAFSESVDPLLEEVMVVDYWTE